MVGDFVELYDIHLFGTAILISPATNDVVDCYRNVLIVKLSLLNAINPLYVYIVNLRKLTVV
jgi:hypothetical protein